MITISAYKDKDEALISKALLEAAGIPVTLKDESGELQLQVRDTDAQLAQEVLVADDSPEWKRRGTGRYRYHGMKGDSTGIYFLKGGVTAVVGFLLLLLFLVPLGVALRVTPFVLLFLFVLGGCVSLIRKSFKVKQKPMVRRRREL